MVVGVIVCEGEFEGFHEAPNAELFEAFRAGFYAGANKYGAGGANVYTRDDLASLNPKHDGKVIAIIEKHLSK